jgi:DNA-directed RNA polymerase specialized sigma24 family protein
MARLTASTRQPPAGGPGSASDPDELLQGLRRGERDDFVRYFQLFRTPVYDFSLRLLRDEEAAVAATAEALSAAFRRVVLDAGPADLQALTYKCALDACLARAAATTGAASAAGDVQGGGPQDGTSRPTSEDGSRVAAALESLELRQRAALLLHDVQGLSAARLAVVFGVTAEAAAALLFRSRVTFRGAFHVRHVKDEKCRQAEQAVAGTVGLGLSSGELDRLRSHATYCRPCRKAIGRWRPGAFGLALALEQAPPPPEALAAPPVFGAAAVVLAPPAAAGWLARMLLPAGRVLRSRTAAYVVAAACLALAAGLALNEEAVRQFVIFESVGPAVELVRAPGAEAATPDRGRDGAEKSTAASSGVSRASLGVQSGIQSPQTAAGTAAPATPADGSPAAETTDGAAAAPDGSREAAVAGDGPADAVAAAKGAAADQKRKHGKAKGKDRSSADHGRAQEAGVRRASPKHGPSQHKADKAQKPQKARRSHEAHKSQKAHKSHKSHKANKKDG